MSKFQAQFWGIKARAMDVVLFVRHGSFYKWVMGSWGGGAGGGAGGRGEARSVRVVCEALHLRSAVAVGTTWVGHWAGTGRVRGEPVR